MEKIIEIPDGYEARIEGNKVVLEPKESEDERIRKDIVSHFESIKAQALYDRQEKSDSIVSSCNEKIAWLEKQKEQKMVNLEIPAGDVAPAEEDGPFDEDEFLEGELSAFLQNYDKEYDDDAAVSDVAKHFYEIGKKAKQKPAEWSRVEL